MSPSNMTIVAHTLRVRPKLLPADIAEIRENKMRLGTHSNDLRKGELCYCPKCVELRSMESPAAPAPMRPVKYIFANVRCSICGGVNEQKYPKNNSLGGSSTKKTCYVENGLCDRDVCQTTRVIKGDWSIENLRVGFPFHRHFTPELHSSLRAWVHSGHYETDPNLKCELRYQLDRRGRRGIKTEASDYDSSVQGSGIHTSDSNGSFDPLKQMTDRNRVDSAEARHFERDFVARIGDGIDGLVESHNLEGVDAFMIEPILNVTAWKFDPSAHKIVYDFRGQTFEEKRHVPTYKSFETIKKVNSELEETETFKTDLDATGVWTGDPSLWTPGHGLVYPLIDAYTNKYRDPSVNALDEATWREKLKATFEAMGPFKQTGWRWYSNPNSLGGSIISTLWNTIGAADEIRREQIEKVKSIRLGRGEKFIEDIYIKGTRISTVAEKLNTTINAVKQKIYRTLNKPGVTEESQWSRAIESSDCGRDGVYAAAVIGGQPRAYLILPATEFQGTESDITELIEDGLHNTICDVLGRRVQKGRVDESGLRPAYREIYDAFDQFGWRMLRDGKWYRENQTEAA